MNELEKQQTLMGSISDLNPKISQLTELSRMTIIILDKLNNPYSIPMDEKESSPLLTKSAPHHNTLIDAIDMINEKLENEINTVGRNLEQIINIIGTDLNL